MTIEAELSQNKQRIQVRFPYRRDDVAQIKRVPGARFVGPDKGGPFWALPLDLVSGRQLREIFGERLQLGPDLRAWGRAARAREERLQLLAGADDAELQVLPEANPALFEFISARPYQRADAAFMATTEGCLNANAPGLGKTAETIAAVQEACGLAGRHLIIAPVTALEAVWGHELRRWANLPVLVATGSRPQRQAVLAESERYAQEGQPFWLVVNPAMLLPKAPQPYRELWQISWDTVVVDEFHQCGMGNPKTLTRNGVVSLKAKRRIGLSGTPIGGKPIKLWPVLNWLHPGVFTGRWRWAETWLEMTPNPYASSGKSIGDRVRPELEDAFAAYHSQYMVRRTKAEVMNQLPPKNVIDVWCDMTELQAEQYAAFDRDLELRWADSDQVISVTNVLAEYTRLRQLANSAVTMDSSYQLGTGWQVSPTTNSGKLEQLERLMEERDLGFSDERFVVFTQFTKFANVMLDWVRDKNLRPGILTGESPAEERAKTVEAFEAGRIDILIMNTQAGGTALTLNRSTCVVFTDETWNPDDQFQAEERNRRNTADIYYLRSRGTIDEYVYETTQGKQAMNRLLLDRVRELKQARS